MKVETFQGRLLQGARPEDPRVLANGKVQLECGCHVFVGIRLDTNGPATAAAACSMRHRGLIERFTALLAEYPYKPGEAKPLLAHVEELLGEAQQR